MMFCTSLIVACADPSSSTEEMILATSVDSAFMDASQSYLQDARAEERLGANQSDMAAIPSNPIDVGLAAMDAHMSPLIDMSPPQIDMADTSEAADMAMPIQPVERRVQGLPLIYDFSNAEPNLVDELVRKALEGLGLDAATGPHERDRVFVGQNYMVWIDETGFYGKMNGLWPLNGETGALNFVLFDGLRPVNLLIVGEDGNGRWPAGYKGAEHIEFPSDVAEVDDDPTCTTAGLFCAQYSLAEAGPYTDSDIASWRACNEGRPSFAEHFAPMDIEFTNRGLILMYEGPLTKQGDFGGSISGSGCHEDFLFSDGVRRRVNLRVGYELYADGLAIDRLLQVRNAVGNPTFDGPFSFIGGFVLSKFPNPHRLKGFHRHVWVETQEVGIDWNDRRIEITPQEWSRLPNETPTRDVVLGWANQPVSLSPYPNFVAGRSLSISNHGPNENGDSGFCLCVVHGGIEMGGGLRTGPVNNGQTSAVSVRRLTLHREVPTPPDLAWVYEAESELRNVIGMVETDGRSANMLLDDPGHLAFGPYASDWSNGSKQAVFRMLIDVVNGAPEIVATADIFDATTQEIVASRQVLRSDFDLPFTYRNIAFDFDMAGREGHLMETRLYWHDISYLRLDRVSILER